MLDRSGEDTPARILIGGPGTIGNHTPRAVLHSPRFPDRVHPRTSDAGRQPHRQRRPGTLTESHARAGEAVAYVAKSPWFGPRLGHYLASGELEISHFIIAIRRLEDAAASRRRVSEEAAAQGLNPRRQPGGVIAGGARGPQEKKLAIQLYRLVETLAASQIPTLLLHFPRFVSDPDYLYAQLHPMLQAHGVTAEESTRALTEVAAPDRISSFDVSSQA